MKDLSFNFKPILVKFSESELKARAAEKAQTIFVRGYDEQGDSDNIERQSTKYEAETLTNVMYGALLSIRWRDNAAQVALDTAEYIANLMFKNTDGGYLNGYLSVYLPLWRILDELIVSMGKIREDGNEKSTSFSERDIEKNIVERYKEIKK